MQPGEYGIYLSSWAEGDRDDIYERGIDAWGVAHADQYIMDIRRAIEQLVRFPELGQSRDDLREGVRGLPVRSHVIYYQVVGDEIQGGRILHHRQDASAASSI